MATTKKRLNITLHTADEQAISKLAKRDKVPEATKAAELLRLAISIEEDEVWDSIASKRDKKDVRFVSHKKAWA